MNSTNTGFCKGDNSCHPLALLGVPVLFLCITQRSAAVAAARWAIGYHPLKRVLNLREEAAGGKAAIKYARAGFPRHGHGNSIEARDFSPENYGAFHRDCSPALRKQPNLDFSLRIRLASAAVAASATGAVADVSATTGGAVTHLAAHVGGGAGSGLHRRTLDVCRGALHVSGALNIGSGLVVDCRLIVDHGFAVHIGSRPGVHRRFVIDGRLVVHCRLMIGGGLVVYCRLMIGGGRVVIHCGLVRSGGMVHSRGMMRSRCRMVVVRRATVGVVTGRAVRRHAHIVHMGRVMPRAAVPGGGAPVRHKAGCRDGCKGEYCCTGGGVAIHRAAIVVAENRETVGIVAGVGPGYGGAHVRPTHGDGGGGADRVVIHGAAAQHESRTCHHGDVS